MSRETRVSERWIQENEHVLFPGKTRAFFNHLNCRVCGPGPLKRNEVPSTYQHKFYKMTQEWFSQGYSSWSAQVPYLCGPGEADVVSSEVEGTYDMHTVMLDVDMPARLIESSTPGHYHLYVDKPLTWRRYKRLLKALMKAEIIEKEFYKMSVSRKATHLRPPWKEKK